jgi:hypothetical protein
MSPSFEGVQRKLERAKAHINDLNSQLRTFTELKPYSARMQEDVQRGNKVARFIAVRSTAIEVPDMIPWVLLAGEALYQLRSALDHLIRQLVIANGEAGKLKNSKRHQFPIFDTPEGYGSRASGMIDGVSDHVARVIEHEQPYRRSTDAPHDDLLWILQNLNNTDKHRLIPTAVIGISVVQLHDRRGKLGTVKFENAVLEHDKVFLTIINDERRYDDIRPDLTCAIAFEQAMRVNGITVGMETVLWRMTSRISDILSQLP